MTQLNEHGHPIKVVARRTGLTPHLIRIWEKRYKAVLPLRTPTNRRLYSDADISRLLLLRRATLAGRSIGQVANLPNDQLGAMVHDDETKIPSTFGLTGTAKKDSPENFVERCLVAAEQLDAERLEKGLREAAMLLSQPILIDQVISPLMQRIGDLWKSGRLRIVHEHFLSAAVRSFVGNLRSSYDIPPNAPGLVVSTPTGQQHEHGALVLAAMAEAEGWRVTYLGPNLPAEEIALAVRQTEAKAVALSIVFPGDDQRVIGELQRLRQLLPRDAEILVGGRSADGYDSTIKQIGATMISDMQSFRAQLDAFRSDRN